MWQAIVITTVIGLFTVAFLAGLSLIGFETDPQGGRTERPTPSAEEGAGGQEGGGDGTALVPHRPGVTVL